MSVLYRCSKGVSLGKSQRSVQEAVRLGRILFNDWMLEQLGLHRDSHSGVSLLFGLFFFQQLFIYTTNTVSKPQKLSTIRRGKLPLVVSLSRMRKVPLALPLESSCLSASFRPNLPKYQLQGRRAEGRQTTKLCIQFEHYVHIYVYSFIYTVHVGMLH